MRPTRKWWLSSIAAPLATAFAICHPVVAGETRPAPPKVARPAESSLRAARPAASARKPAAASTPAPVLESPVALLQPESTQPPVLPGTPTESFQPPLLPESVQPPSLPGLESNPTFDDELFQRLEQAATGYRAGLVRSETLPLASQDVVNSLQESNSVNVLNAQQRSPISFDPHVRGYRIGQIYTQVDGAFYFPVRTDLDTVLSKLDPALIQSVEIIPGPYGIKYGPGFSFINVQTVNSPRYNNGYETHGRTGFDYRSNGGQVYGRETVWGGSSDWGFIFSYGIRNGGDYHAGSGQRIPASYEVQNFNLQLGFDLSPDSHLEIRGTRLDQGHTEYALQFFDINFLVTDALTVNYINDNPLIGTRLRADAWWNNTRFGGDTFNTGKQTFGPINRVDIALANGGLVDPHLAGNTSGDLMSVGAREVLSFGNQQDGQTQIDVGADARVLTQSQIENFTVQNTAGVNLVSPFRTNQPQSEMTDLGGFIDITLPWTSYFKSSLGYRLDYVHTGAQASEVRANTALAGVPASLPQDDILNSYYLLNDLRMTDIWTLRFGGGHADRAPTMTDRYADGIFLGIIQDGFTRIFGNPNLAKESLWQLDVGLRADYDVARGGVNYYYSWINDYITYLANPVNDPSGARKLTAINTPLATLAGVNGFMEADWTTQATSYFVFNYVRGEDVTIAQPLAQIYPLDTRLGMRFKSTDDGNTWGLDSGLRMVASQNRFAQFLTDPITRAVTPVEARTAGFTTCYVRGYYNLSRSLHVVGGVENLFNRQYLDHLALRLGPQPIVGPPAGALGSTGVFSPGITPYMGVEWTY